MEQFRSVLGGFPSCEKSKVWRNAHSILPLYKTTHDKPSSLHMGVCVHVCLYTQHEQGEKRKLYTRLLKKTNKRAGWVSYSMEGEKVRWNTYACKQMNKQTATKRPTIFKKKDVQNKNCMAFPAVKWFRVHDDNLGDAVFVPDQGTKIPHTGSRALPKDEKKKEVVTSLKKLFQ